MNKVQIYLSSWMNRTQTTQQDLSLQAGRAISYVSNVMIGRTSGLAAIVALDKIVHFPPGIADGMKPFKRKKEVLNPRDVTALIRAWPLPEKRV